MKSAEAVRPLAAADVTQRFGGHVAVDDVSLSADRGEVIVVIGQSGSGESTFLRCLNFSEPADSGYLDIAGEHFDQGASA